MEETDRLNEIERKIENLSRRVDDVAERLGQRIEVTAAKAHRSDAGRLFWGVAFIAAGLIWFGNRMGWFYFDIPLAAGALIVIGAYMIFTSRR